MSLIDACSRYLVHWRLLPDMTAEEVALVQLEALEKYPGVKPEIVSDRGSQYTSREYRKILERFELEHIPCRVAHPQSNGIIERYHRSTRTALRDKPPAQFQEARDIIAGRVADYNEHRLHAGLRSIEPAEYSRGNPERRMAERRAKFERGRSRRRQANPARKDQSIRPTRKSDLPTADVPAPTTMVTHSRRAAVCG